MLNKDRTKVLIIYNHKDGKFVDRLDVHLAFYKRHWQQEIWDERKLLPGAKRQEEIKEALDHAGVAILLISADFLASEFIVDFELPTLLAAAKSDGAIILPAILSPCGFPDSELAQFQAVNDPARPLSMLSFHVRRESGQK